MDRKLVIFDMDDVMWDLNRRVADRLGILYSKFTTFSVYENPNLTAEEKEGVLKAYQDVSFYRNIEFRQPVVDLINRIYNEHPECLVQLNSNSATREIRDEKMMQLLNILDLPEADIHLHVIAMKDSKKKMLPEDIFLFVDDSIHNQLLANAVHKIMPARPQNGGLIVNGMFEGQRIDRPETDEELEKLVMDYINRS